jgi:hypothetical protein
MPLHSLPASSNILLSPADKLTFRSSAAALVIINVQMTLSTEAQTDRRDLRLAEVGGLAAQTAPSRHGAGELDLYLRHCGLQPGKNEETCDGVGSSVPDGAKNDRRETKMNQKRIA